MIRIKQLSPKLILTSIVFFLCLLLQAQKVELVDQGTHTFSFRLLKTQDYLTENIVFSPYSIKTAFSILLPGAGGDTKKQIRDVIGFPENDQGWFDNLSADIANDRFSVANALWYDQSIDIYPTYLNEVSSYADHASLNFSSSVKAASEINQWFAKKTANRITNMVTPENLLGVNAVIANTLYLKSSWINPFNSDETYVGDFKISETEKRKCTFMSKKESFADFYEDLYVKMIKLDFNDSLSFYAILPQFGNANDLQSTLSYVSSYETFEDILNRMEPKRLDELVLPKFTFQSNLNLKPALQSLGMQDPFIALADFSGMSPKGLHIENVFHNTFFSIDEEGVEAASGTAIFIEKSSAPSFLGDRPFLFVVMDQKNMSMLVLGAFNHPD